MKRKGHYCKVCDEYKANEKFSGKGHAAHICKACAQLLPEEQAAQIALNQLHNLPWQLSREQKNWLQNRLKDKRPEVRELAREQYEARFGKTEDARIIRNRKAAAKLSTANQDRVEMAKSLCGVLGQDMTLEQAREARLDQI